MLVESFTQKSDLSFDYFMQALKDFGAALEGYLLEEKYDPNQPRVPRGQRGGGRWTTSVPQSWSGSDLKRFKQHFKDHHKDFGVKSPAAYARKAQEFYKRALREKFPMVKTRDGYLKIYHPKTNRFGVFSPDGKTETFFKPRSRSYFEREIGKETSRGGRVVNPLPKPPAGGGGGGGGIRGVFPPNFPYRNGPLDNN